MRTDDFRPSDNVEDDREGSASRGGLPGGAGGLGTVIVVVLISWYFGIDPSTLLNGAQILTGGSPATEQSGPVPPIAAGTPIDPSGKFVARVLGDTEDRWKEVFAARGLVYHPTRLRLFKRGEQTRCGFAQSAMGPFYCPIDKHIYLDLSFIDDLENKFGGCSSSSACQFSEAYVIAHEVGHHVQDELGLLHHVMEEQQAAASKPEQNQLQVRVELQADCYAGVWAKLAQQKHAFLDPGDIDTALQTAAAIGDDRLQKRAQGYVVPDSFTHGTSEQRKRWFSNGFNGGRPEACDTMSARAL
jgi:uncharacterized protein